MKQFWTTVLGAFLGAFGAIFVCSIISFIISVVVMVAMSGIFTSESKTVLEENSILKIDLTGDVPDRGTPDAKFMSYLDDSKKGENLTSILNSIAAAKTDKNIKGIYIECNGVATGVATLYEIRNAIQDFKSTGKWVYAFGNEGISQGDYYVASAADSVFINPVGILDIHGLGASIPYFKRLLDKVGVEMQVVKVGTFKSAVEPYIMTEMSDANKLQQTAFLGSIWNTMSNDIAKSRKINVAALNQLADSITLSRTADYLIKNKMVDGVCYKFNFEKKLKHLTDVKEDDDLKFISPSDFNTSIELKKHKEKIAVLYAEGEIDNHANEGVIADDIIKSVMEAAKDKEVKGLVMRVNSPGGSAFDSEQMWAALEEFKKTGKPYAVSMGSYAASGGYYISCGADRIFAEPVTITGSIGIFGMIPNISNLLTDKLGVDMNTITTNANGNFVSITQPMTPFQRSQMQNYVNKGYELFTSRCAKGRHMSVDSIKKIEGRVWDGKTALKLGLVDQLGGMKDAMTWVAKKAKLENYSVKTMPSQKDFFEKYLSKFLNTKIKSFIYGESAEYLKYKEFVEGLMKQDRIQARMEYIEIE